MLDARRFLANYTVLAIGDIGSRLISFWALVRIAHVVGTDLFGNLAFATAFTAYFALLIRQGLDTYGIQQVAREPSTMLRSAQAILGLRLAGCLLAALVLGLSLWTLDQPGRLKLLILLSGLSFLPAALSLHWAYQAMEEMKYGAAAHIFAQLIFALLTLTLLRRPSHVLWVPVFQFCGEIIAAGYLLLLFRKKYGRPAPMFDRQEWGVILRQSLPMGLSAVFGVVMFNFDMVLLGFLKPASDVGAYSAAYRFINFFAAFVHLYAINLLPVIARYRSDPAGLGRLADQAMRYTLVLAIPLAAGGALLAKPLIVLIFGTEYAHGSISLQILLWIIPLITLRTIFRNVLVSHGLQRQLLGCMSLAAGVNIALNLLLIPRYSFVGAAAATLAAESILLLSLTRQVSRKVTRLLIGTHVWKPAAASLPMVLFLVWFRTEGIVGRIAAGGLLYLAFAWAAGAYRFGEICELFQVRPAEREGGE